MHFGMVMVAAVVVSGGTVATVVPLPSVAAATNCSPDGVVATPSRGSYDELLGVSALTNSDVRTVGHSEHISRRVGGRELPWERQRDARRALLPARVGIFAARPC